jgi:GT2 family glycosyltransferase
MAPAIERPSVSVVVPFLGDRAAAARLLTALERLDVRADDELIVADNSPSGAVEPSPAVRVVAAPERRSAYHARNAGARAATGEWILFTDADCELPADLLDSFWEQPPEREAVVVAGEVVGDGAQAATLARWARSRRRLIASHHIDGGPAAAGTTANLLVRRDAFEAAGGFEAGVRSDADLELCWRLQERGGSFAYRPAAQVLHRDPERLGAVLRQAAGYGAGRRWVHERYGDAVERPALVHPVVRALGGALVWAVRLKFERAVFKLIDGAVATALWWGWRFGDNAAR